MCVHTCSAVTFACSHVFAVASSFLPAERPSLLLVLLHSTTGVTLAYIDISAALFFALFTHAFTNPRGGTGHSTLCASPTNLYH